MKLPDCLAEIGAGAFRYSGLVTIDLSSTKVTKIDNFAFDGCLELKEVKLPDCLAEIGDHAFRESGLVTIDLSLTKVEMIGEKVFEGCKELKEVKLPEAYLSETCCLCGGSGKMKHRLGYLEYGRGSNIKMQLENELTEMYHWDQMVGQIFFDLLVLAILWGLLTLAVDKITALYIAVGLKINELFFRCGKCIRCDGSGKVTWNEEKLNWIGKGLRGFQTQPNPTETGKPFRRPGKPMTDYDKTQEEAGKAEGDQIAPI